MRTANFPFPLILGLFLAAWYYSVLPKGSPMQTLIAALALIFTVVFGILHHQQVDRQYQLDLAKLRGQNDVEAPKRTFWKRDTTAMLAMVAALWLAVAVNYLYVRPFDANTAAWDDSKPLHVVYSPKSFSDETVVLDGNEYMNSTFDRVTFEYRGTGATRFDNATFVRHPGEPAAKFTTKNKVVGQTAVILTAIGQANGCDMAYVDRGPSQ